MPVLIAEREGFNAKYSNALEKMGIVYRISLESAGSEDALLLPGGGDLNPKLYGEAPAGSNPPDDELDEKQLRLCRLFISQKKPILGICRGLQLLNVALGGNLIQHLPTAKDHVAIPDAGDAFHAVNSREGSVMRRLYGEQFVVCSSHHQACHELGSGLIPTLFADDGTVEAAEHESLPVIGVQFHPERMMWGKDLPCVDGSLIFQYFKSLLSH